MKVSNHGYIGTRQEDDGTFRCICKCGHATVAAATKSTAMHRLISHKETGAKADERKAARERSVRGKKAYAARKRAERAAKREEVS